jgi:hypothetical protein
MPRPHSSRGVVLHFRVWCSAFSEWYVCGNGIGCWVSAFCRLEGRRERERRGTKQKKNTKKNKSLRFACTKMVEEKALLSSSSSAGRSAVDRESLIQEEDVEGPPKAGPSPPSAYHSGREVCLILTDNSWPSAALALQRFFLFFFFFFGWIMKHSSASRIDLWRVLELGALESFEYQ